MNSREKNIDSLRTLCALFVIIVHVCVPYIGSGAKIPNSTTFWIASSIQIFTRIAVPIFVLISGRYLLSNWNQKSLSEFYKRRYVRIIVPLIFSIIIYGFYRILAENSATFTSYMSDAIKGYPYGHLWYFYMLLGMYAITPLLYKIKNKISLRAFRNLGFIMLVVAMATQLFEEISGIKIPILFFIDYVGFFITGYTLKDYKPKFNINILLGVYLGLCVFGSFLAIFLQANGSMFWMILHMGNNIIATPDAIFLYLFFSNLNLKKYRLEVFGKYTLGIYIIHNMIISSMMNLSNNVLTGVVIIDILLYFAASAIASLIIVKILWSFKITRRLIK